MEKHWVIIRKVPGREEDGKMEKHRENIKKCQEGKRGEEGKMEKHWENMKKVPGRVEGDYRWWKSIGKL